MERPRDVRERIKGKILSWEEHNERAVAWPYVVKIKKPGQLFVYFGAEHSQDKADPQVDALKTSWKEFIKKASPENSVVLVEGGVRPLRNSIEEAIEKDGEAGLITFLAHESGVPVFSPEPSDPELWNELAETYAKEEILYYDLARGIVQWHRMPEPKAMTFEEGLKRFLEHNKKMTGWTDVDFTLDGIRATHKRLFGTAFDANDRAFFYKVSDPAQKGTSINEISRADDMIRDPHIVEQIKNYWDKGKSVFAVYGGSHVVVEEPALRDLLK